MIYSCPKQPLLEVHLIFINGAPLICWFFIFKNDPNGWLLKVSRNFILLFQIQKSLPENVTCLVEMDVLKIDQS